MSAISGQIKLTVIMMIDLLYQRTDVELNPFDLQI